VHTQCNRLCSSIIHINRDDHDVGDPFSRTSESGSTTTSVMNYKAKKREKRKETLQIRNLAHSFVLPPQLLPHNAKITFAETRISHPPIVDVSSLFRGTVNHPVESSSFYQYLSTVATVYFLCVERGIGEGRRNINLKETEQFSSSAPRVEWIQRSQPIMVFNRERWRKADGTLA
jgi:hypothetical protein